MAQVQIYDGDLLSQPVEIIVNSWNQNIFPWWLLMPKGVPGAIKQRAGVVPFRELSRMGLIPLGGAVMTSAGRLPFKAIIHVAGINLFWRSSEQAIRKSINNALEIAANKGYCSIAFPIIGSGAGGYSKNKALTIMRDQIEKSSYEGEIRIIQFVPNAGKANLHQ